MAAPLAFADVANNPLSPLLEGPKGAFVRRWVPLIINVAALLLLAAAMADWTWRLVGPPSQPTLSSSGAPTASAGQAYNLQALLAAHLFGEAATAGPVATRPVADIPPSSLDLILTGIVAAGPESFALIKVNTEPEAPFAIGEEITHGVTLREVYPDRAIIQRRGVTEALLLEDAAASLGETATATPAAGPGGIQAQGGNNYSVDREMIKRELRNPDVFRQALIVPNAGGGFLVRQIQPGSIYAKLGLQVGDVVRKINGRTLNSVDEVLRLYQQLGGVDQVGAVQLEVMRAGRLQQLEYTLQ
ncbi:MAG: type II secretion system protein N [Acidiferrobacterales bacterium]